MLSAADQLQHIQRLLLAHGGGTLVAARVTLGPDDLTGILRVRIRYRQGQSLAVVVRLDVAAGFPAWRRYSFHVSDADGQTVFRYDNAPHYPLLTTFPHHQHVGRDEAARAHPQPSLRLILEEMARTLGPGDGGVGP